MTHRRDRRWRLAPGQPQFDAAFSDIISARPRVRALDAATYLVIESVAAAHAETSPVRRSKRRSLDVLHALGLDHSGVQWFYDRRDGFDLTVDHAHAMALLPAGQLVDLTARQFDPVAPYPLVYPHLAATGRDWKRYQLTTGLALDPSATAELPLDGIR